MYKIIKKALLLLIRIYQRTLSPDSGWLSSMFPYGYCKYYPTCSEYTYRAIHKHGVVRGTISGGWRIIRCNPFSRGGIDNVN